MTECEICGKPLLGERVARIDGVIFRVCEGCVKLGEPMPVIKPIQRKIKGPNEPVFDDSYVLIENFGEKIKNARERRGMSQLQLAARIGEKESVISRAEHNAGLEEKTLKKIGRFLGISLYEKGVPGIVKKIEKKELAAGLTLGDVATVKRKRA